MKKTIKVGIVGLGRAGCGTIPGEMYYGSNEGLYDIVAECDILPDRVENAVEKYGCKGYDNIDALLADPDVELVVIATRSIDHFEHAMKALKAGKDVIVEKPVSINYDLAKELVEYGSRPDTPKFYVRQNRRFETVFNGVLEKINSGILGTVSEINIEQRGYERRDDWQTLHEFGGGPILNWGLHIVDYALCLLGAKVAEQYGTMHQSSAGGDREDHFSMHLIGENGRKVNIRISGTSALNSGRIFTVYGNRGAMICKGQKVTLKYIDSKQKLPEVIADPGTPGNKRGKIDTFEAAIKPDWIEEEYEVPGSNPGVTMWGKIYENYRGGEKYPVEYSEILDYMKVINNLRDGNKIRNMTESRDKI